MVTQLGRPPLDKARRERDRRRAVLHKGMVACYEILDMVRNELAELDAVEAMERTTQKDEGAAS